MKIPFFNLKSETTSVPEEETKDSIQELFRLIKLSEDNNKEIKEVIISKAVELELKRKSYCGQEVAEGKLFGYKIKVIPDVAVVWKEVEKKK